MELIVASQRKPGAMGERTVRYGFRAEQHSVNPFYHLLSAGMYVYQRCVSPVIARSCAYSPSCSGYSKALIKEYGLLKGSVCTADRLMRCNRITLADPATSDLWIRATDMCTKVWTATRRDETDIIHFTAVQPIAFHLADPWRGC